MITLQELCRELDQLFSPGNFPDRAPNGLQVEGNNEITSIATGVSACQSTIEGAIASGADALIVHHGMFWQGDSYVITRSKKRKLQLLLDHGISLLAYHIPMDAHQKIGNNWKAAHDLSWTHLEPFGLFKGIPIGVKGQVDTCSPAEFKRSLEMYYGRTASSALGGHRDIRNVALISGGAHWSIKEALDQGIDAFVTGTHDEPIWNIAHEENIHFFALGHAATEKVGPRALCAYLRDSLGLTVHFLDTVNPF